MSSRSRTVVVTGGTAGIGRASMREFTRNGSDVATLARGQDGTLGAFAVTAAGAGFMLATRSGNTRAVRGAKTKTPQRS